MSLKTLSNFSLILCALSCTACATSSQNNNGTNSNKDSQLRENEIIRWVDKDWKTTTPNKAVFYIKIISVAPDNKFIVRQDFYASNNKKQTDPYVIRDRQDLYRTPTSIEGYYAEWYENGQLANEYFYIAGKEQGICNHWYENGNIQLKGTYINGKKIGIWTVYNEDGHPETKVLYANDKIMETYKIKQKTQ